jgi:hypothetical protein
LGGIWNRELLARYKSIAHEWTSYTRTLRAPDFKLQEALRLDGLTAPLDRVGTKGEYLQAESAEKRYTYRVYKRGRQIDIAWESIVNDGLGALTDFPQRLADAARHTDEYQVTLLYEASAAPNTALFGAPIDGVTNIGALPLNVTNIGVTMAALAALTDPVTGLPTGYRGATIVVPPALEIAARIALTSIGLQWDDDVPDTPSPMGTTNPLPQMGLKLIVNPWLPICGATDAKVNTTWFMFADPSECAALGYGHLVGHESPEICMKASNKVSLTGAPMSQMSGDFESDNVLYRVRAVCGGAQFDPRGAYCQTGS